MGRTELRERIAELISEATGGEVSAADVLAGGSMIALGVDSLGLLRLVDAIELEYGVEIELTAAARWTPSTTWWRCWPPPGRTTRCRARSRRRRSAGDHQLTALIVRCSGCDWAPGK